MTHDERCNKEATCDVIFVFQQRWLEWTEHVPDGYFTEDGHMFREEDRDNEERECVSLDALHKEYGSDVAIETWRTEAVWLDRDEAEEWGANHAYNYSEGWRVYGVPAKGQLAKLLRAQDCPAPTPVEGHVQ